jgi:hypothetical protein
MTLCFRNRQAQLLCLETSLCGDLLRSPTGAGPEVTKMVIGNRIGKRDGLALTSGEFLRQKVVSGTVCKTFHTDAIGFGKGVHPPQ